MVHQLSHCPFACKEHLLQQPQNVTTSAIISIMYSVILLNREYETFEIVLFFVTYFLMKQEM